MIHVGDKLYEERIRKNLTLDEVARATKIRVSFLQAIEKGDYKSLPSGTYAHGFVRNYARFLGLPEHETLALFKREYSEEKFKVLPEGMARRDDFPLRKFKFTQALKILPLVFVALMLYLIFQYRAAIFNPALKVSSPLEDAVFSSQSVTVIGKTDPNVTVFVNSEVTSLDEDGNFKKTVNIFPGKVKIIIKAVNKFNRTTIVERAVEIKI